MNLELSIEDLQAITLWYEILQHLEIATSSSEQELYNDIKEYIIASIDTSMLN